MNILPCEVVDGHARFRGHPVTTANQADGDAGGRFELGVRPEFVALADHGIPVEIVRVADVGRRRIVEAMAGDARINAVVDEDCAVEPGSAHLAFDPRQTRIYVDGWVAGGRP
jgi:glycerol transport system ATP-binding protein